MLVTIKSEFQFWTNLKTINNEELKSEEEKTYCLWTWLDSTTPNEVQNTYFVANLSFDAEYKPKIEF